MQSIKKLGCSLACVFLIMLSLTACQDGEPPGVVVEFPAPASEAVALIIKYQAKSSYHGSARVALDCYVKEYRRGARAIKLDYSDESADYFFHVFILSAEYYPLLFDSRAYGCRRRSLMITAESWSQRNSMPSNQFQT